MDRSNVINLVAQSWSKGTDGVYVATESITEVYCDVRSVTQTEWFEAGRAGIEHPAFTFIINRNEYNNEQIVEFNGQRYGVYRTYMGMNEDLELHCEAKGGLIIREQPEDSTGSTE